MAKHEPLLRRILNVYRATLAGPLSKMTDEEAATLVKFVDQAEDEDNPADGILHVTAGLTAVAMSYHARRPTSTPRPPRPAPRKRWPGTRAKAAS